MELTSILAIEGFKYDIEDNLWYDENPERQRYLMRVGVGGPYMDGSYKAVLFNGGYDYRIGEYRTPDSLKEAIYWQNKSNKYNT